MAASFAPLITAASDSEIDEIVVTATRRAISSEQVSSGLTVVSREHLETQKLITDALASKVGVFLQQTTPGQGAAIIRGLKGSSMACASTPQRGLSFSGAELFNPYIKNCWYAGGAEIGRRQSRRTDIRRYRSGDRRVVGPGESFESKPAGFIEPANWRYG